MYIINMLLKILGSRLKHAATPAGLMVLLYCAPLWGSIAELHRPPTSVPLSNRHTPLTEYFCQRGSRNGNYRQWQDLSPQEQERMKEKYREWQSLSPEERQAIRQRMNQLNKMPSQQRSLYKQLFRQWQHLPADERQKLQKDLDNWDQLSPQQQNSIRRRFKN